MDMADISKFYVKYGHQVMVFKATFNDISVFLVEETGENH
jgi:hypothetical protein